MDWLSLLYEILDVCLIPLLAVLTTYIVKYIQVKNAEIQNKIENDTADKYIDMLANTIISCVTATNQTYVEALKKDNAFTVEAQKEAFKMTYNSIMAILTEEAKKCLTEVYGDLTTYISARIEAEVNYMKNN